MPIKVKDNLPAKEILKKENIFVMDESRAYHQDIRPIKIALLNLMPIKQSTEVQLLRLIGNTPLQIEVTLLHMESYFSKNTPMEYLLEFYNVFGDVKNKKFDGMIITGAPIEHLEFEDVGYWNELEKVMEWSKTNVTSTMHICWGAQAALYYHYGIKKYIRESKMFGVFPHTKSVQSDLLRGFDDVFYVPYSIHSEVRKEDFPKDSDLRILCESDEAGICIAATENGRQIFVTGHFEYDPNTLRDEYLRDIAKGDKIDIPKNYFKNDDPKSQPIVTWRCHANLLFSNWLNYYVYQETPYILDEGWHKYR